MSSDIEREREKQEDAQSRMSMKRANYKLTDDIDKRCNVCNQGQIVLGTGIRLCKQHIAFVTCGATCDLQIAKEKLVLTKFEKMKIEDESETQRRTREYDEARSGDEEE